MNIIACSDLHGNYKLYQWIVDLTNDLNPDLITISGDLFGYPDGHYSLESAQNADAEKVESILSKISKPILFIMGNDDFVTFDPGVENIQHIHSSDLKFKNFNFIGYEYSLPFVGGIYEKPELDIESDLYNLNRSVHEKTIFITHSPAFGILDRSFSGFNCGSKSILKFIKKHKIYAHIHGHIHEAFGNIDIHFNVAAGGKKRAMLINLDNLEYEILS